MKQLNLIIGATVATVIGLSGYAIGNKVGYEEGTSAQAEHDKTRIVQYVNIRNSNANDVPPVPGMEPGTWKEIRIETLDGKLHRCNSRSSFIDVCGTMQRPATFMGYGPYDSPLVDEGIFVYLSPQYANGGKERFLNSLNAK